MTSDRLLDIFRLMTSDESDLTYDASLCSVAKQITDLTGAGIFITSDAGLREKLCTSDGVAQRLMDLELTLKEGPGYEAIRSGTANDVSDLLGAEGQRWRFYTPAALELGARAVFGFPIRSGAIVFGALSLYRDHPGPLSEEQSSSAYLMAAVIGRAVLAMQAGVPPGALTNELQGQSTFDFSIHQASGMLSVQARISVKDALIMLHAHAFTVDVPLSVLARRIINRETRFDFHSGDWLEKELGSSGKGR
ncbi:MAG: GAF and ANTAR domain-containing protein [Acidimicrobiaceae bacterium]|nr:GAF and ANTAR domain-containing protein [Acidimicrobiaceae bacterium]